MSHREAEIAVSLKIHSCGTKYYKEKIIKIKENKKVV